MNLDDYSIVLEEELVDYYDFEGILISKLEPTIGFLVVSSKDDSFTFHIFQMILKNMDEYHVTNEVLAKTFTSFQAMLSCLETLSNFKDYKFYSK